MLKLYQITYLLLSFNKNRGELNVCFWENFATNFEDAYYSMKVTPVILIIASGKMQEYKGSVTVKFINHL